MHTERERERISTAVLYTDILNRAGALQHYAIANTHHPAYMSLRELHDDVWCDAATHSTRQERTSDAVLAIGC
jgi:hypothetical protein